jgi:hypothetical protein
MVVDDVPKARNVCVTLNRRRVSNAVPSANYAGSGANPHFLTAPEDWAPSSDPADVGHSGLEGCSPLQPLVFGHFSPRN